MRLTLLPTLREFEEVSERLIQRTTPQVVRSRHCPNLHAVVCYPSKIYAAYGVLRYVLRNGLLRPGQPLLEVSSGTQALCLATFCNALRLNLCLIVDRWCDPSVRFQLQLLGATVIFAEDYPGLGSQANRLRVLREVREATGGLYLEQYDQSAHSAGFTLLAEHILECGLDPDVFVFPVGSGASSKGILGCLRMLKPSIFGAAVDVLGSVPFGQLDIPGLRTVGGIGNSIMPRNVDHELFDEVHFVSGAFSKATSRYLLETEGLWRGDTTGPVSYAAAYYAKKWPNKQVAFLSPDGGERYQDSTWNPSVITMPKSDLPDFPMMISHPSESRSPWCALSWRRRTYLEVIGRLPNSDLYKRIAS